MKFETAESSQTREAGDEERLQLLGGVGERLEVLRGPADDEKIADKGGDVALLEILQVAEGIVWVLREVDPAGAEEQTGGGIVEEFIDEAEGLKSSSVVDLAGSCDMAYDLWLLV